MPLARVPTPISLTLLESRRVTSLSHRLAVGGSIVGQVAAMCGAAMVMARVVEPTTSVPDDRPSFLAPLLREHPRPVQEVLSYAALGGVSAPEAQPAPGDMQRKTVDNDMARREKVGTGDDRPPSVAHEDEMSRAFSDIEVDSAASRDPDSEGPVYPPTLMAKGIEGSVLATFIVGVDGRPDLETYIALEATDSLFAIAVRDALPRMKFRPAKINSTPVRQLVEQRFFFKVVKRPVPLDR